MLQKMDIFSIKNFMVNYGKEHGLTILISGNIDGWSLLK